MLEQKELRSSSRPGELRQVIVTKKTKTVRQTAWILSTSPDNIKALIKMGKLRALKLGETKIPDSEIDRFVGWALDTGTDLNALIKNFREERHYE